MNDYDHYKTLLIDAICGVGMPTLQFSLLVEKQGWATRSLRPDGFMPRWDRAALFTMLSEQLEELYALACHARQEAFTPTDMVEDYVPAVTSEQFNAH